MNAYQRIELKKYYDLNELENIISFKTMHYHYNILHKNYEVKLLETLRGRKIEEESEIEKQFPTLEELMRNLEQLPEEVKNDVRFFGGGLINHNFFFAHLAKFEPKRKEHELEERIIPSLLNIIQEKFTDLKELKKKLVKSALKVKGSGWTWLVLNKEEELEIINTANQDGPWSLHYRPLIAIDV